MKYASGIGISCLDDIICVGYRDNEQESLEMAKRNIKPKFWQEIITRESKENQKNESIQK